MDVRCDRCETEYELDDAIVTEAGASVQCTTCGHTFIVTRRSSSPLPAVGVTPPPGGGDPGGPGVPEWTLSTDDGKVHRFRDLNTLQKWIVERKVTRSDHISRSGGPWLSLGDVVELVPFFSVVDEADRARPRSTTGSAPPSPGAVSTVRARTASGQFRSTSAVTPPPVPIEARRPVSEDGPTVPNRPLPGFGTGVAAGLPRPGIRGSEPRLPGATPDPRSSGGAAGSGNGRQGVAAPRPPARTELVFGPNITEESRALEADFLRPSKRGRNIVIGLVVIVLGAGGGGYWWWTQQQGKTTASIPPVAPVVAAGTGHVTPQAVPQVTPQAVPQAAPQAAPRDPKAAGSSGLAGGRENVPVAGAGGSAVAGAAMPAAAANLEKEPSNPLGAGAGGASAGGSAVAAAGTGAAGAPGTAPARGRGAVAPGPTAREGRGAAEAGSGRAGNYDRLVADADRLLDRGKSAKADKLYAQALAARPDGVAALTGSAYVLLDRQRHFKAIETFRRALGIQPGFGPALFGIAESYRARGDSAQALAAYRQYLAVAPSGADAPAARRQIKDLEAGGSPASKERSAAETPPSGNQDQ